MTFHRDCIRYDATFKQGEDFGVITCPKCDCKVLYGLDAATRPKYCPKHEDEEFVRVTLELTLKAKQTQSDYGSWQWRLTLPDMQREAMQELRMPMPKIQNISIQEMIQK